MKNFLIVRVVAIGDVVLATPLLNRIRAEHPDAHVTWLCASSVAELVALFPGVNEIVAVDETKLFRGNPLERAIAIAGVWRRLMTTRFDRVLMLHPDIRYRILTWPLRTAEMSTARHGPHPDANPVPGRFRGDESARLLDGPRSSGPIMRKHGLLDLRDRFPRSRSSDGKRRALLVPGGARNVLAEAALKRWPVTSYRSLAEELLKLGMEVTLVGNSDDAPFGRQFAGLAVHDMIGKTTLPETLQQMRDADIVVAHDTGPLHLARLVRTPTVALFGPTDPAQFVGDDPLITVLWGGADLACRPCYDGKHFARCADNLCINRVGVAEVLAAVKQRLASTV